MKRCFNNFNGGFIMNEQNIMENNEAIEVAEKITSSGSGHVLGIVGGVLAVVGLAYGGYKLYKKNKNRWLKFRQANRKINK